MKRLFLGLVGIFGIILLYLVLWPVPFDPATWSPQQVPALTGVLKPNNRLSEIELLKTGYGPEAVAIDNQGRIYTGLLDGRIIRIIHDRSKIETFCDTNGRPLGLKFDAGGNLIVADAFKGLLSITKSGIITVLCNEINGVQINFVDDLDIAKDGTIYFSDASSKFSFDKHLLDLWEFRPHGRLLAYYPATKNVKILLEDLYFANGVSVSHDQTFVLVNETWTYRIRRYWISGFKKGQSDFFIENLPGMPDNITFNGINTYWVAIVQGPLTRKALDPFIPKPFLRKVVYRLPEFLKPAPIRHGYVLGLDLDGNVIYNYQDPTGTIYADVTSVIEHNGAIYLGSIGEDSIGRLIIH